MKILIPILVGFLLITSSVTSNWTLQITIVIPPQMVPYYEWLITYPGLDEREVSPEPFDIMQTIRIVTENRIILMLDE